MRATHDENNFDFIRIAAAYLVLVSHSWAIFGRPNEFLAVLTNYETGGGLAVVVFFFISGYLVYGALERRSNLYSFVISRGLRILPGLFVAVVFCVLVVGPLFTTLSPKGYFSSWGTWRYLGNALVFPIQFPLPGVFAASPVGASVNGSLWTLPIEVASYGLLFVLFAVGILRRATAIWAPLLFFCAFTISQTHYGLSWNNRGGNFLISVSLFTFLRFGIFFFTGCAYFVYRDILKPRGGIALMALCLLVSTFRSPAGFVSEVLAVPYLVYYTAHVRIPLWKVTQLTGDISYGIYIYAFPIQQSVYAICGKFLNFWEMVALSALVTTMFAALSWRYIESPALNWKKTIVMNDPIGPRLAMLFTLLVRNLVLLQRRVVSKQAVD